jgi:PAS domain S-box-containing protein
LAVPHLALISGGTPQVKTLKMENPSMGITLWFLILILFGLGAWGFYQYRRQDLKMQTLKHSLLEINQKTHAKEDAHTKNQARWEQTEEKLRSFLLLMDTVMNTIPNPIYFKDAEGVYQGCNKVFAKQILGLTRDRIIGKRPMEMPDQIPADLAAAYQREEYKMIDKAGFHTFETQVQCADGQRRDFLFSLAPVMDRQGNLSGSVAVLSDLTEKNRAARHRMQKEKLEGVLEIAGAVCHELNQPLQAISGYTELMAMKLDGHEAQAYIDKFTTQIERMRDITDKLQGVTRYETKDYAGNTKIIDINKSSEKQ